ncbi:glycosyltransferase family 4 protein [Arthrobacter sp. ERGS1:01]|uniref:glycosyltransferase family 4 protein n=1 Tax=Arthrobacter sp. ERGS1:01 TaxID=1704044 RepID=UPI0009EB3F0C
MVKVGSLLIRYDGGGAERVAAILSSEFDSEQVIFQRIAIDPALPGEEGNPDLTLLRSVSRNQVLRVFLSVVRLRRLVIRERLDVLHLNCEAPDLIGLLAWSSLSSRNRPRMIRTEHTMNPWDGRPFIGGIMPRLLRLVGCRTVYCYDSNSLVRESITIPNPISVDSGGCWRVRAADFT